MKEVELTKTLLEKYSNEELVCWIADEMRKALNTASKVGSLEMLMPIIAEYSAYLSAVADKMRGGNKPTTVL